MHQQHPTHRTATQRTTLAAALAWCLSACVSQPTRHDDREPAIVAEPSCPPGTRAASLRLGDGVAAKRCVSTLLPAQPQVHGPERVLAERTCTDGTHHRLVVTRRYDHGLAQGEEVGTLDGSPMWRLHWRDGRADALRVLGQAADASGTGWLERNGCSGMAVCGAWLGHVVCAGQRGQRIADRWMGPGVRLGGDGVTIAGTFDRGDADGRGVLWHANGDRYEGELRASRPHGDGQIDFAGGGWLVGRFVDGELDGRVTVEYPTGIRVVTRWRAGVLVQLLRRLRLVGPPGARTEQVEFSSQGGFVGAPGRRELVARWLVWQQLDHDDHVEVRSWRVYADHALGREQALEVVREHVGDAALPLSAIAAGDPSTEQARLRAQLHRSLGRLAGEGGGHDLLIFAGRGALVAPTRAAR